VRWRFVYTCVVKQFEVGGPHLNLLLGIVVQVSALIEGNLETSTVYLAKGLIDHGLRAILGITPGKRPCRQE
jgi:hypothetical protein